MERYYDDGPFPLPTAEEQDDILNLVFSPPLCYPPSDLPYPVLIHAPPSALPSYVPSVVAHSSAPPPELDHTFLYGDQVSQGGPAAAKSSRRGFRHMSHMTHERERRERLSQGYADLRDMLSLGSKGDKIAILKSATERVRELTEAERELRRRNGELQTTAATGRLRLQMEGGRTSPVAGAIGALQFLKQHMELRPETIRIVFSGREFSVETAGAQTQVTEDRDAVNAAKV